MKTRAKSEFILLLLRLCVLIQRNRNACFAHFVTHDSEDTDGDHCVKEFLAICGLGLETRSEVKCKIIKVNSKPELITVKSDKYQLTRSEMRSGFHIASFLKWTLENPEALEKALEEGRIPHGALQQPFL